MDIGSQEPTVDSEELAVGSERQIAGPEKRIADSRQQTAALEARTDVLESTRTADLEEVPVPLCKAWVNAEVAGPLCVPGV